MAPFVNEPLLPVSFAPRLGESIRSYLNALADANGYRTAARFQVALGLTYMFGPLASDEQWNVLARATGVSINSLTTMRRVSLIGKGESRQLSLLGSPVNQFYIDKACWKVCPRCLEEDGYGREIWSLSYAMACPRHHVLLVDSCHECGKLLNSGAVAEVVESGGGVVSGLFNEP